LLAVVVHFYAVIRQITAGIWKEPPANRSNPMLPAMSTSDLTLMVRDFTPSAVVSRSFVNPRGAA
jgi:hypothetical protein